MVLLLLAIQQVVVDPFIAVRERKEPLTKLQGQCFSILPCIAQVEGNHDGLFQHDARSSGTRHGSTGSQLQCGSGVLRGLLLRVLVCPTACPLLFRGMIASRTPTITATRTGQ